LHNCSPVEPCDASPDYSSIPLDASLTVALLAYSFSLLAAS
jgi:hypothetical protein